MGRAKIKNGSDNVSLFEEKRDEAISSIIKGLNVLIAQANITRMGTATRILCNAKEELVHWAVNQDFHETEEEKFINRHLYDGGPFAVAEFLNSLNNIENKEIRDVILNTIGISEIKLLPEK